MSGGGFLFRPSARLAGVRPYSSAPVARAAAMPEGALRLDANEGYRVDEKLLKDLFGSIDPEKVRRYPKSGELEGIIAERWGVDPACVVVTAGADDALDRVCRVTLDADRSAVLTTPTFEMIPRYVRLAGASAQAVEWAEGKFPVAPFLDRIGPVVGAAFVVSPNNPTGLAADAEELLRIARASARAGALLALDLAYGEYAEADPTAVIVREPGTVVVRTLSKAWGLAGLRVGYAIAAPDVADALRAAGNPYAVSSISRAVASAWLREGSDAVRRHAETVRRERAELSAILRALGAAAEESQANFVLARFDAAVGGPDAWDLADALAHRGVLVRRFARPGVLGDCLRITCPGEAAGWERLRSALAGAAADADKHVEKETLP